MWRHTLALLLLFDLTTVVTVADEAGPAPPSHPAERRRHVTPDDEVKFYRRVFPDERRETFFNLNQRRVVFELSETPLPFLDWAIVETGHIGWMGDTGEVAPLNDPHTFEDERRIIPVPFSVASGVRIRAQPPAVREKTSEFVPVTFPWEVPTIVESLFFDEKTRQYHAWYNTRLGLAYANSKDLKTWHKPLVNPTAYNNDYPKTNALYISDTEAQREHWMFQRAEDAIPGSGGFFFVDHAAPPEERFKTTFVASSDREKLRDYAESVRKPLSPMVSPTSGNCVYGAVSPDGVAWHVLPRPILLHDADTQTVTRWDEELARYVMYTRLFELGKRTIARSESSNFADFPLPETVMGAGPEDPPYVDYYANSMAFYPGHPTLRIIFGLVYDRSIDSSVVRLACSRNGKLWHWLDGPPILASGKPGSWEANFVRTVPSFVPTPDDEMLIFYEGSLRPHKFPRHRLQGGGAGIARWKRDRLAALEAPERGQFTTCFLRMRGNRLLLNMQTERSGQILVEVFDDNFHHVDGRTFAEADSLTGDGLEVPVTWNGDGDLSGYRDKIVILRFKMRAAKLFSVHADD